MFGELFSLAEKIPIEVNNPMSMDFCIVWAEKFKVWDMGETVKWEFFDGQGNRVIEFGQTRDGFDKSNLLRRLIIRPVK